MITDEWKLRQACDICIADMGKEDDELSKALYQRIAQEYGTVPGVDWDYNLVDDMLQDILRTW